MANPEAASIRNQAQEALNLHSDGQHEDALARAVELAAAHPGSALVLNLAGLLHRHAALVAMNDMVPGDDDDDASALDDTVPGDDDDDASALDDMVPGDDDDDVSALEQYHRHAALDAFSAAARLAPDCVLTGGDHAQALADCDRYEDAQKEFLRVLNRVESNDYADPALHNVVFDMSGVSSRKERRRTAAKGVNLAMERFAANINNRFLPLEALKLLDANDLGGPAADEARDTYSYSARAQLLRAYIELAPVRALDTAAMDKKRLLLRHALLIVPEAAETFDCSLLSALFHAKLLFLLDHFDRIGAPTDPNWDDIPPMAALGADPADARVSYVKKQLRVLLKQIIVVPALYWSSYVNKSAAKTISDARRFLKNRDSWSFWICLNSGCSDNKFVDTGSLWQHMRSKHRDALWGKLQSVIDPEHCENTSQDDHWLDGIILRREPDTFLLPRVQDMFESLLLSPSIGIKAEPFAEMRQRKCREGSQILDSIREKLRMLPQDTLSTEDCTSGIANLWLNFLEITLVDYREVILPLARSFQWTELKNRILFYLNHPGSRRVEFADALLILYAELLANLSKKWQAPPVVNKVLMFSTRTMLIMNCLS